MRTTIAAATAVIILVTSSMLGAPGASAQSLQDILSGNSNNSGIYLAPEVEQHNAYLQQQQLNQINQHLLQQQLRDNAQQLRNIRGPLR